MADLFNDEDVAAEQPGRSAADIAKFRQLDRQKDEKSSEEIAREIEMRHKMMEEQGPDYEDDDMATGAVGQQAMLPTVNDPKLWMVKARAGHEREACVQLLQKSYNLQRKGTPILIKSVFALDHLKVRGLSVPCRSVPCRHNVQRTVAVQRRDKPLQRSLFLPLVLVQTEISLSRHATCCAFCAHGLRCLIYLCFEKSPYQRASTTSNL